MTLFSFYLWWISFENLFNNKLIFVESKVLPLPYYFILFFLKDLNNSYKFWLLSFFYSDDSLNIILGFWSSSENSKWFYLIFEENYFLLNYIFDSCFFDLTLLYYFCRNKELLNSIVEVRLRNFGKYTFFCSLFNGIIYSLLFSSNLLIIMWLLLLFNNNF